MSQFPSLPDDHQLADVFKRFPQSVGPLLAYHDRVLRDWSPLTVAERELIAAYVSALNACTYCHGSHQLAAEAFGIDASLLETLLQDPDSTNRQPVIETRASVVPRNPRYQGTHA